jgi:hypothetical protein
MGFSMQIRIKHWPIRRLVEIQDRINPRPQFQRGEVWRLERKQLLIDSILRVYDLPKIYLSQNKTVLQYDYDVADGQQRLRAIWAYFKDEFPLGDNLQEIQASNISGIRFSGLPPALKKRLRDFKLTIALIEEATQDELRTLFARLQLGVVLTPAELRNAIASAVGSAIHTAAETHPFFTTGKIPKPRFKRQDYLAHAIALAHYNNGEDLKAPLLARLYRELAFAYDKKLMRRTYDVLDILALVNQEANLSIRNKWGFVDLFWFLFQLDGALTSIDPSKMANTFVAFETQRIANNKAPEVLLEQGKKHMYDYIRAFNTSGGDKSNLTVRNNAITTVFKQCVR